jgi:hypothetical protein
MEYCVITSASEQLSNHIGDFTSKWYQKTRSRAECWTRMGGVTCQRHRFDCVASTKKKIALDVCAYLIQVSELHIHFRRITRCTHIPNINTLYCVFHCPICRFITDTDTYRFLLRNNAEQQVSHLHSGGSQKSRKPQISPENISLKFICPSPTSKWFPYKSSVRTKSN